MINDKRHNQKVDWGMVEDKDIPAECVTARPNKKNKNYLSIPSTERAGVANELGRNCFAVYALLTTAQAMDPTGKWRKLPIRQLTVLGLDRYKIYRAMRALTQLISVRLHLCINKLLRLRGKFRGKLGKCVLYVLEFFDFQGAASRQKAEVHQARNSARQMTAAKTGLSGLLELRLKATRSSTSVSFHSYAII